MLSFHEHVVEDELPVAEDLFEAGPDEQFHRAPSGQWTPPVPTYPGPEPTDAAYQHTEAAGAPYAEDDEAPAASASEAADGSSKPAEESSRWSLSRFTRGLSGL